MLVNPLSSNSNNGTFPQSVPVNNTQFNFPFPSYSYDQFGPSALTNFSNYNPYGYNSGFNQFSPFGNQFGFNNGFNQFSPFGNQFGFNNGFNQFSPFGNQFGNQFGLNNGFNQSNGPFGNQLYNQALESMAFNRIASGYLTDRINNPYGNTSWIGSNQRTDNFLAKNGIDPHFAYLYPRLYAQLDNALDRAFPGQVTQPNAQLGQLNSQPAQSNQFFSQLGQFNQASRQGQPMFNQFGQPVFNQFSQPNQFNQFAQQSQFSQPTQTSQFTQPIQTAQTTQTQTPPISNQGYVSFPFTNTNSVFGSPFTSSSFSSPTGTVAFTITLRIFVPSRSRLAA